MEEQNLGSKIHRTQSFMLAVRILLLTPCLAALSLSSSYQRIAAAKVVDPATGSLVSPLDGVSGKSLVVVLPQLGDFDTAEICEQLVAIDDALTSSELSVRVVGIGDAAAASKFSAFTGLPLDQLRVDPDGTLHRELGLHAGPGWTIPDAVGDGLLKPLLSLLPGGVPKDEAQLRPAADAWLNYLASMPPCRSNRRTASWPDPLLTRPRHVDGQCARVSARRARCARSSVGTRATRRRPSG